MSQTLFSQDNFNSGELSPLLYSRITLAQYFTSLKTARNVICLPQGGARKRFGTKLITELSGITDSANTILDTFQYLEECVYLFVIHDSVIDIYLDIYKVATVATPFISSQVSSLDYTTLQDRLIVCSGQFTPYELKRTSLANNAITGFTADTLTITNALTLNFIYPVRFTAAVMPVSSNQIYASRTYFIKAVTTTTVRVYLTEEDASNNVNWLTFSSSGTTAVIKVLNSWAFSAIAFQNIPVFDFGEVVYTTFTFTPGAPSGNTTITSSNAIFDNSYIGGLFQGNSGVAKINSVASATVANVTVLVDFYNINAIQGQLALVAKPCWTTANGFPKKCSSYQNRLFFANTDSLPNGIWGSVTNDYYDFNEYENTDDSGISWFPTSGNVNSINNIVPYRTLTVYTNSGVYSTPLNTDIPLTPSTFMLSLQDSTISTNIFPESIDNQIMVPSGNEIHSFAFDGYNMSYTSNIISLQSEHLFDSPISIAAYNDKQSAGSRYMFVVNQGGDMVCIQSLKEDEILSFTPMDLYQSYGSAYIRAICSSFDGRAWFLTERQLASAAVDTAITAYNETIFTAVGSNIPTTPTQVRFSTTGTMPSTTPQLEAGVVYYAIGFSADLFSVYLTAEDALANENAVIVSLGGIGFHVSVYALATKFFIEQLDFNAKVDMAVYYSGAATNTISGQNDLIGQDIKMLGDGYGYSQFVEDGIISFDAHGEEREVTSAQFGFPIQMEIKPLPINTPALSVKMSNLVQSKKMTWVTMTFNNTVGGVVRSGNVETPIAIKTLDESYIGYQPVPASGMFEMSMQRPWNDFSYESFSIFHDEPFGFTLTGLFYKIEV